MRKFKITVLMVGIVLLLTACGTRDKSPSKEEYKNMYYEYLGNYESSLEKIKSLEESLNAFGLDGGAVDSIKESLYLPDGTKEYLNVNAKVHLGEDINLEPYNRVPNQMMVYINDEIAIKPTKNWTIQLMDDGVKMEHTSGVYGEIISYDYAGEYDGVDCYSDMFEPYIKSLGEKEVKPRLLFVGGDRLGYTVDMVIKARDVVKKDTEKNTDKNNKKDTDKIKKYNYTFGLMISEGKITTYKFFYKTKNDGQATKELVNNTIASIWVNGEYVTTE